LEKSEGEGGGVEWEGWRNKFGMGGQREREMILTSSFLSIPVLFCSFPEFRSFHFFQKLKKKFRF
jgi:hypothetical protein